LCAALSWATDPKSGAPMPTSTTISSLCKAAPKYRNVLAAGRLGSQASQSSAWLASLSVCMRLAASRVRFAGLRPPLTQPTARDAANQQNRHLTSE